jgi:protocatechuate 3,4-dioxygenase beta subunit
MKIEYKRRDLLRWVMLVPGLLGPAWAARAASLLATPPITEGPFYPKRLPLDDDNDLTRVKGAGGVAKGEILDLTGRVVDSSGRPLRGAQVEIWQCNAYGRYHHPDDNSAAPIDPNFQGHGMTIADSEGRYRFRTIKPVPYPGRTPHIHFKLTGRDFNSLTTQMFVAGEPQNERDFLYRSIRDERVRKAMAVQLRPAESSSGATLAADFEIVLGQVKEA